MAVFTNFATLSYNGITRNSNTVTGEIVETVAVEKTAVSTAYSAGDTLSYAVSLVNSGPTDVSGLTVTDDLGAYELDGATLYPLSYVDGTVRFIVNGELQAAPAVTAGPPLVFTGIDIPAGGSAVLIYEADVTGFAPLAPESEIINTVTVTGGGVSVPLTASAAVGTQDSADLMISKALSPAVVPSGEMAIKVCGKRDFDLILMDYMMPEMDGIEAMKQIREKYPSYAKVPIIAFTADAVEESRERLLKEGMDDFLAKPVKIEDMEAILKKWLPKELQKNQG